MRYDNDLRAGKESVSCFNRIEIVNFKYNIFDVVYQWIEINSCNSTSGLSECGDDVALHLLLLW